MVFIIRPKVLSKRKKLSLIMRAFTFYFNHLIDLANNNSSGRKFTRKRKKILTI
jgi:hypothetical protein